ncbi:MAG TPA: zinc-dependent metalloprotease [Chitinophagaceae bacterium]|nr:zinc-dependent metalloprotease [Chitinophagaceae bacterium]
MKNLFRTILAVTWILGCLRASGQVPALSSYPAASSVIFLDFDGQYVTGTSWNYNGPIDCAPSGLTTAQITEVFNRVAEDYRPFNINVTTDSTKYLNAPIDHRIRIIVTVTNGWYPGVGGVSFIGSYNFGDDTPAFVFSGALLYKPKNVAEACAHEAGHSLGLYHQAVYDSTCKKISDYNSGAGSGEIGWAPIMGVGYYENFTLWNNGPNPYGCSQTQNDLSVITTQNNFSFRADDYPNTPASAQALTFTGDSALISGIIEQNTDADVFRFTMPTAAEFHLEATPYNVGSNNAGSDLDMQVTIYNETQTRSSVYNPGTLLSAVVDTPLNAGTYYIKVEGKGNQYAPDYASLGSYSLKASLGGGAVLPLHQLLLSGMVSGSRHELSWTIRAEEQVTAQTLEVSADGSHFIPLASPAPGDRSYGYLPQPGQRLLYRLRVDFDNGSSYYSNVVSLQAEGETARPRLAGNVAERGELTVNSPGTFGYEVLDLAGRALVRGQLSIGQNRISLPASTTGLYLIRFSGDASQWTEKFIRQ